MQSGRKCKVVNLSRDIFFTTIGSTIGTSSILGHCEVPNIRLAKSSVRRPKLLLVPLAPIENPLSEEELGLFRDHLNILTNIQKKYFYLSGPASFEPKLRPRLCNFFKRFLLSLIFSISTIRLTFSSMGLV